MTELFGIPMNTLMWLFGGSCILIVAWTVVMAIRRPVLMNLATRNIPRRWARSVLIMLGLTLATTIITAALATGDTIRNTARSEVLDGLGTIDEIVSAQEESDIEVTGEATQIQYFDQAEFDVIRDALASNDDVDGVIPAIWEEISVQNLERGQTEPRVLTFAADPAHMAGFGRITGDGGREWQLKDLASDEIFLNREAGEELDAQPGSKLTLYAASQQQVMTVKDVVDIESGGGTDTLIMMTLTDAQELFQKPGQIKHVIISNRGNRESGVGLTEQVIAAAQPTLDRLGLAIEPTKKEDLQAADDAGATFSTFFVTFGSFSIAAGILLIFLIFVMLAAERKPEMGIARAVGSERVHLVQMFLYEGLVYDLAAAAVGAAFGIAVAYLMVSMMASSFGDFGFEMRFGVTPRSLITSYAVGVVLTFIVVTVSAWRVSVLNIVTAIRNLPDPAPARRGKGSLVLAAVCIGLGLLLAMSGLSSEQVSIFFLGISLLFFALVPISRWLGASDRAAFTLSGGLIVAWWLLPASVTQAFLPEMSSDFNVFIIGGLIAVTGATWVVMFNSDIVSNLILATVGRVRSLTPMLRTALVYPLTNRFRTGVTLAMFTLVVFTMVVGSITTGAFTQAFNDINLYGGGYQIAANAVPANPVADMDAAVAASPTLSSEIDGVTSQTTVLVDAKQEETTIAFASYPLRGMDDAFFDDTTYGFAIMAEGYDSPKAVWQALKDDPRLAVVDALPAPRRNNYSFAAPPTDFRLEGFYLEDDHFEPISLHVVDAATGNGADLTIIAVLKDVAPVHMIGITTSQRLIDSAFPGQAAPTAYLFRLKEGADAEAVADDLEASFLANGLEATVLKEELSDIVALNQTFNYIVQGFLGLGLIVGVAALGVISARTVVERRQEIGVMRAIGFERGMVQLSFLVESSMVALAGIALGTVLGLIIAFNVIQDSKSDGSWETLQFTVPWFNFLIIYGLVYGAALLTSYFPARQASRVYPAEALRYE